MENNKDNTRINLKHYIGNTFDIDSGMSKVMPSTIVMVVLGLGGGFTYQNLTSEDMDNTGTDKQEQVYNELSNDINQLTVQKRAVDISGDAGLATVFAKHANNTLTKLFTSGSAKEGADISEKQFDSLLQLFPDDITSYGYQSTGAANGKKLRIADYLDECMAVYPNDGSSDGMRANKIQQCTADEAIKEREKLLMVALPVFSFYALMMLAFVTVPSLKEWSKQPARLPKKFRKTLGNH